MVLKIMSWKLIDIDNFLNVAMYLNFSELKQLARSNKEIWQLMNESFWQKYLYFKFQISKPIPELTFTGTAKKVYDILIRSQRANKYFTLKAFLALVTFNSNEIDAKLSRFHTIKRDIIPDVFIIDNYSYDHYPTLPDVTASGTYTNHWGFNYIYNPSELQFLEQVDKYVHRSAPVVTLNGLKYINYDLDQLINIVYNPQSKYKEDHNKSEFLEHLIDIYRLEEHFMILRHLGGHF